MIPETDRLSFPKDRIRVLLLEGINDSAANLLLAAGYTNMVRLPKALDEAELLAAVEKTHILGIRSRTQLTDAVFAKANRLFAVGCFSVGTNQVDLRAAAARGVPVLDRKSVV